MSFHAAFNRSRRKASGTPNTTTAIAAVPTRQFCEFSFIGSVRIRPSAVTIELGLRELHITVDLAVWRRGRSLNVGTQMK
jgi:hypothetical protein